MHHTEGKLPPEKEPAEVKAIEKSCNLYYTMGYSDGFAKGQEQGIKIAAEALKMQPGQTITFQMPDYGQARDIMNAFGTALSRQYRQK